MEMTPTAAAGLRQHLTAELARVRAALDEVPAPVRGPAHRVACQRARECALLLGTDAALPGAALRLDLARLHGAAYL